MEAQVLTTGHQAVADQMKIAHAHPAAAEVVSGLVAQGVKIGAAVEFDETVSR